MMCYRTADVSNNIISRVLLVQRTGQIDIFDFEFVDIGLYTTENNGRQTDRGSDIGVRGARFVVLVDVFRRVLYHFYYSCPFEPSSFRSFYCPPPVHVNLKKLVSG